MLRSDNLILHTLAGCFRFSVVALSEKYSLGSHCEVSTLSSCLLKRQFWLYLSDVWEPVCAFCFCALFLSFFLDFLHCLVHINERMNKLIALRLQSSLDSRKNGQKNNHRLHHWQTAKYQKHSNCKFIEEIWQTLKTADACVSINFCSVGLMFGNFSAVWTMRDVGCIFTNVRTAQ